MVTQHHLCSIAESSFFLQYSIAASQSFFVPKHPTVLCITNLLESYHLQSFMNPLKQHQMIKVIQYRKNSILDDRSHSVQESMVPTEMMCLYCCFFQGFQHAYFCSRLTSFPSLFPSQPSQKGGLRCIQSVDLIYEVTKLLPGRQHDLVDYETVVFILTRD